MRGFPSELLSRFIVAADDDGGAESPLICLGTAKSDDAAVLVQRTSRRAPGELAAALNAERVLMSMRRHRHVAQLAVSSVSDAAWHCLVFEGCTGGDLFDLMQREGALSESQSRAITRQLLRAVAHCHAHGVVHRDIKLQNVWLDDALQVRLAGFGIAHLNERDTSSYEGGSAAFGGGSGGNRRHGGSGDGNRRHGGSGDALRGQSRLAKAFETLFEFDDGVELSEPCGTSYYIAPEVLRGRYSRSADLWSVGVILYCLLCGFPPFNGVSEALILEQVKHGVLSFAHEAWREVSESAKELVRQLLTRDRHKRVSAAAALRHAWLQADPLESAQLKLRHGQISQREYEHLEALLLHDPTFERHEGAGDAARHEAAALEREIGGVCDALRAGQLNHDVAVRRLEEAWTTEKGALERRKMQLSSRLGALQTEL